MKKKKRNSLFRAVFILFALILVISGLVSIVKVANTSTETRSKAAEITSILKPSWEFSENGNSEGWDAGNFGYSVTDGFLTGTTLGKFVPLPLGQSLEAEVEKNNKPKKQNKNNISDNSGPGMPITNVESYLVNNNVNATLPYGLKGVNIRMSVGLAGLSQVVVDANQTVNSEDNSNFTDESEAGSNLQPRKDCTECKFGRFCTLFIEKIPGFCPAPSPIPRPSCTPMPPPCEGPRCPKYPTVIPPGGWCPPNQAKVLKFRVEYNAVNMLPQATPRSGNGNYVPPQKPFPKPLYFDVIADGQMHDYQIQFPNIDKFNLKNLKLIFAGVPAQMKISIDYIRLVSLVEIKPTIFCVPMPEGCNVGNVVCDPKPGQRYCPVTPTPTICKYGVNSFTAYDECSPNLYRHAKYSCYGPIQGVLGTGNECLSSSYWSAQAKQICYKSTNCDITPTSTPAYTPYPTSVCIPLPKCSYEGVKDEKGQVVYCSIPPPPPGQQYCPRPTPTPCPTPPTCSGQLIIGDPKDTSQCPVYRCSRNVVCTQEAKLCPNGTYVSRGGPNCEFTPCPE